MRDIQVYGTIKRKPASGRPSKLTAEVKQLVDAIMQDDDKTAHQPHQKLLAGKGTISL